jgi:hypothetical protein
MDQDDLRSDNTRQPWLLWCGVVLAMLMLGFAFRAWLLMPTTQERIHGRIRAGMSKSEVENLFKPYNLREPAEILLVPNYVLVWGTDDEAVVVTFNSDNDKVLSAEYHLLDHESSSPFSK